MTEEKVYDAAEAIDALLEEDDGALLAAMARFKSSLVHLFGREGLVEMLRQAVDASQVVDYYSRRSRREIDPMRPEVNLRVDDGLAAASDVGRRTIGATAPAALSEEKLRDLKAAVIFEEVCKPLVQKMNEALAPHWARTKAHLQQRGLDVRLASMLLCTMYSVRVSEEGKTTSDRMCTLSMFV